MFALVTVLEPITAVAAETGSQETQTQEQEKAQEQQEQVAVQSQEGSEAPEGFAGREHVQRILPGVKTPMDSLSILQVLSSTERSERALTSASIRGRSTGPR